MGLQTGKRDLQRVPWNQSRGAQHTHSADQAGQLLLLQPCRVSGGCSVKHFHTRVKLEPPPPPTSDQD